MSSNQTVLADNTFFIENSREPLRHNHSRRYASFAVAVCHILFFASFTYLSRPALISLGAIDAELVREGDFFEAAAISEADPQTQNIEEEEKTENPDFAAPAPNIADQQAPILPQRKDDKKSDERKNKEEKKLSEKHSSEYASERREAQARRRTGVPGGGRTGGAGASRASCLAHIAAALRAHTPGATALGPGTAHVTFHVSPGGGVSGISATGSTAGHAALARRIVAASRGPSSCGAAFVYQQIYFD